MKLTFEQWIDEQLKDSYGYVPEKRLNYELWGMPVRLIKNIWEEAQENK